MRAQQPGAGGPQAPTMVTPMGPPPRPPMGQQMDQPQRPPMGQIVTQDRPHERPHVNGRRPVRRTGAASYARSLAPLVGMSIVVVVLIAGITAWISSFQERPAAAPPAPRPAAGTTTTASPFPSSAVVPSKAKVTPTQKPKAKVTPTKVVPPAATSTKAAAPTSPALKTTKAVEPTGTAPSDGPEDDATTNCGGIFQQPC